MFLAVLTFIAAFAIEGLGTLVSVIGLSLLFGANPIIIAFAIALDVGKLINVTLLYSKWRQMGVMMRTYALLATFVTMVITSAGAAGYLSGEFQKAILGTQEGSAKIAILKEQQTKYEARKKQIDDQIARVPDTMSARDRTRVIANFKQEQVDLQRKLNDINAELPKLQVSQIGTEAKAGPIVYVSKAFNISVEEAVKWVILLIIFVFDPLAVFLLVAGNMLLELHRNGKAPLHVVIDAPAPEPELPTEPEPPKPRRRREVKPVEEPPPKASAASDAGSALDSTPPASPEPAIAESAEEVWHPNTLLPADEMDETDRELKELAETLESTAARWRRQPRVPARAPERDTITLESLGVGKRQPPAAGLLSPIEPIS